MVSCPDEVEIARWLDHGMHTVAGNQLEAHVDRCVACAELIAHLGRATTQAAGALAAEPRPPRGVQPGDKLGRFSVLELVGSGGMGVVYAADDPELNRKVAIKLLRPDHRAAAAGRRLQREAKALAKITHPNVIAVYDVGTIGDDVFVAMEFIEGPSLREWLVGGRRSWREVVDVFGQAARGLAAAHAAGLVHRDFKPGNVLVGDDGRVRVLDFGLARAEQELAIDPPSDPDDRSASATAMLTTVTRTGSLAGTPAYMSPEQIRGERADARSDQFSFCVALYEALYGARPFAGNSLGELARAIATGVVGPERDAGVVPRWLRKLVLRGLAADPGQRFASMEALCAALGRGVDGRRRWLLPVAIGIAVAALTSAGWLVFGSQIAAVTGLAPEPPDACLRAGAPIESVWNADRAAAVHAALISAPGSTPGAVDRVAGVLDRFAGDWARRRTESCRASSAGTLSLALYRRAETCFDRRRNELERLVATVVGEPGQRRASDVLVAARSLDPVADCTNRGSLLAAPEPAPPALARGAAEIQTQLDDLFVVYLLGKAKPALPRAEAAVAAAEKLGHQPLLAEAYYRLGVLQDAAGELDLAEATFYRAVWTAEASRNDTIAADAWIELVSLVGDAKADFEQAGKLERHAQAALDRLSADTHKRASLFDYMGSVRYRAGKLAEAEVMYRLALAAELMGSRREPVTIAHIRNNLALPLRDSGKRAEAIELLVLSLDTKERELGADNPRLSVTVGALATALAMDGHVEAAIPMMKRSLQIKLAAYGPGHYGVCYDEINLAEMQGMSAFAAQREQAIAGYRAGIDCSTTALGADHPTTTYALVGLGTALIDAGHADEAVAPLEQALTLRTARKGTPTADIEAVKTLLARARKARSGQVRARARARARARSETGTASGSGSGSGSE